MSTPTILHVAAVEYSVKTLLLPQLDHLARSGYRPRVACTPEDEHFGPELAPFDPVAVALPRTPGPSLPLAAARLAQAVRTVAPDILHLHSPAAALTARMVPRSILQSTAVVYTVHGFAFQWDDRSLRSRALRALERAQAHWTDALLFQSEEDLRRAQGRFATRLAYLGNGVGDDWFQAAPIRDFAGPIRLLFVGRLVAEKGLLELVRAVGSTPQVSLSIVGAEIPSERDGVGQKVRALVSELGLRDRVSFQGFLSGDALREAYRSSDVFVLPSYREGLPRSIIEAMAHRMPIVATRIRGCRELVTDGVNGFLVEPASVASLAGALRRMAQAGERVLQRMSEASATRAESYRESAVFDRLIAAYTELGFPPSDHTES